MIQKIVLIGSGNLATRLSHALYDNGFEIIQIFSKTDEHAKALADCFGCAWTTEPEQINPDADLYIFALKDTVLEEIIGRVPLNKGIWVHTAGSMPMSVFENKPEHYGVFYMMQSFSKQRTLDFSKIPFFIEASDKATLDALKEVAGKLSDSITELSTEKRRYLHLAAVFANNFTNHIYALAGKLLEQHQIPFEALLPLIDETAAKVHEMKPLDAQTGPAIRYDKNVINKHIAMLDDPVMKEVYQLLSDSIHKEAQQ